MQHPPPVKLPTLQEVSVSKSLPTLTLRGKLHAAYWCLRGRPVIYRCYLPEGLNIGQLNVLISGCRIPGQLSLGTDP